MGIMRWCLPAQKTSFQLRILNVPLGKSHIGVWTLSYPPITFDVKNFCQVGKGTWFPIISEIN